MAEMVRRGKALLCGASCEDQLRAIVESLGMPQNADIFAVTPSMHTLKWTKQVRVAHPRLKGVAANLQVHCPQAEPLEIDLMARLLAFDPSKRLRVTHALEHPFLCKEDLRRTPDRAPPPPDPTAVMAFDRQCASRDEQPSTAQMRSMVRAAVTAVRTKSAHEASAAAQQMVSLCRGKPAESKVSPKRTWADVQSEVVQ